MTYKLIVPMLLCVLAAACQQEPPDAAGEARAPVAAAAVVQARSGDAPAAESAVLLDGYSPSFAHTIRSQRHEPAGARYRHVVIVEYTADTTAVIDALQSDLKSRGYKLAGPAAYQDAIRIVAEAGDGTSMVVTIHGEPKLELQSPKARGLVTFSWLDNEPR